MWRSIKYILAFFAIEIVLAIPVALISCIIHLDKGTMAILILGFGNMFAGLYIFQKARLSFKSHFSFRGQGRVIILGILASLFLILPESALISYLELPDNLEDIESSMNTYLGIIVVGIIAPVVEELLFRGAILRSLLDWERISDTRWIAVVITAFLFSLIHLNPVQMPGAFIGGLIYGYVTIQTGSLVPAIVMHIVNNTSACVLGRIVEQGYITEDSVLFGSQTLENMTIAASTVLCGLCLYLLTRHFNKKQKIVTSEE